MSLALVAVLVYGIGAAGGWDAVVANAQSLPGYLTMMASHNTAEGTATSYSLLDIVSTMAWGLGYFGMPHILLRFMAIEDEKKLVLSRRIASVWVVIAMTASIVIGVVGVVLARDPDSSVFGIVSFAWAGFGGAYGAVMLCGGLMVFVWKYLISPLGGVFGIYELLPAFLFSLAACVVVSLATPAPGADIEAEFEAAK